MALSVVGTSSASQLTGGDTTMTLALPGGVAEDDLILVLASAMSANQPVAIDTGYTHLSGSPGSTSFFAFGSCKWKKAGASEADPVMTLTTDSGLNAMSAVCIVLRGQDLTTPIIDSVLDQDDSFDTTYDPTSLAAGGLTCYSLLMLLNENDGLPITWPTGWVEQDTEDGNHSFGSTVSIALNSAPGTGTVDPATVTITGTRQKLGWHVLVAAASGGGGPAPSDIPMTLAHNIRVARRIRVVSY